MLEARIRIRSVCVFAVFILTVAVSGCGLQIYNFGGAGTGNKFVLPPGPAVNGSAVVQSWAAYSLSMSTCQLENGGASPSSYTSFDCERRARKVLSERWRGRLNPAEQDDYLDQLEKVRTADFLDEYVWIYLRKRSWTAPQSLDLGRFDGWRKSNLGWHRPTTRLIGYWTNP